MISHARLRRALKPRVTAQDVRHYELVIEQPGSDGRTLTLDLFLNPLDNGEYPPWRATLEVGGTPNKGEGCDGLDPMTALRRLADWTRRAADALDLLTGPTATTKTEIVEIRATVETP